MHADHNVSDFSMSSVSTLRLRLAHTNISELQLRTATRRYPDLIQACDLEHYGNGFFILLVRGVKESGGKQGSKQLRPVRHFAITASKLLRIPSSIQNWAGHGSIFGAGVGLVMAITGAQGSTYGGARAQSVRLPRALSQEQPVCAP